MKRCFLFYLLSIMVLTCYADNDYLLNRNGNGQEVKLLQISDGQISYTVPGKKNGPTFTVPTSDVYMIYVDGSGNFYFTPDGKRISGETERADSGKHDVVYLTKGGEIACDGVRMTVDCIVYNPVGKRKGLSFKKKAMESVELERSEVFMIVYKNGMRDVITPLDKPVQPVIEEKAEPEPEPEPQFRVVMHTVERGETLEKIAKKYGVEPSEIIEWNELPASTKVRNPIRRGTQYMIYVAK